MLSEPITLHYTAKRLIKAVVNPFENRRLHLCCSYGHPRKFPEYIFFREGVAYASDTFMLLALSLRDIGAHPDLIACLEGKQLHYTEMINLNTHSECFLSAEGQIFDHPSLDHEIKLSPINENYMIEGQYIFEFVLRKKHMEHYVNQKAVTSIRIDFSLVSKIYEAMGEKVVTRLCFMHSPAILLEFINYENSYGILMPCLDVI
jgi:hypothetical protein